MPIPAPTVDIIQQGLAGVLDNVDKEQAQIIAAGIMPTAIEMIKLLLDTLKLAKQGLPCDAQMVEAQKLVKKINNVDRVNS